MVQNVLHYIENYQFYFSVVKITLGTVFPFTMQEKTLVMFYMPTKRSDAQPLVEREKQFECRPVEISSS